MKRFSTSFVFFLLGLLILLNFVNMYYTDMLGIDSISFLTKLREMISPKELILANSRSTSPLLIWITNWFFSIFGKSTFVFRLPSLIFMVIAIVSTYGLARIYYGGNGAVYSSLIFTTFLGSFFLVQESRAEIILMGTILFTIWQNVLFIKTNRFFFLVLGSMGLGFCILAGGPIGMIIPLASIGLELVFKKDGANLFNWQWLLGILIMIITISPLIFLLYQEIGSQGLRYFFWLQLFKGGGMDAFANINILWVSFLPWIFLAFISFTRNLGVLLLTGFRSFSVPEIISTSAITIIIIISLYLTSSLTYLVFLILPFSAIQIGGMIDHVITKTRNTKAYRVLNFFQVTIAVLLWISMVLVGILVFPMQNVAIWLVLGFSFIVFIFFLLALHSRPVNIIVPSIVTVVAFSLFVNFHVHSNLMNYVSEKQAALHATKNNISNSSIYSYLLPGQEFVQYFFGSGAGYIMKEKELQEIIGKKKEMWILTSEDGKEKIETMNLDFKNFQEFDHFYPAPLYEFFHPGLRTTLLEKRYFGKVILKDEQPTP